MKLGGTLREARPSRELPLPAPNDGGAMKIHDADHESAGIQQLNSIARSLDHRKRATWPAIISG
jgi:hypothetical protein